MFTIYVYAHHRAWKCDAGVMVGVVFRLLTLTNVARYGIITFYSIAKQFSGSEKMIQRGENAYKSGHVTEFTYDSDVGWI